MSRIQRVFLISCISAIGAVVFTLLLPSDQDTAVLFRYSQSRLLILGFLFGLSIFYLGAYFLFQKFPNIDQRISDFVWDRSADRLLTTVSVLISLGAIFLCVLFIFAGLFVPTIYQAYFVRLIPAAFSLLVPSLGALYYHKHRLSRTLILRMFFLAIFILMGNFYLNWAKRHAAEVNELIGSSDQRAYLQFAQQVYDSDFSYKGGRNRMPLYPYIQALFLDPDAGERVSFEKGKLVNIYLSLSLLALLFFFSKSVFSLVQAGLFTLTTALALFIYKAGYFQAEILYYFLFFLMNVLLMRMLTHPSKTLALAAGTITGLAFLAKSAVIPGLVVFIFLFLAKEIVVYLQARKKTESLPEVKKRTRAQLVSLLLVLGLFLIVIFPYILETKRLYGRYFYNVNSTFYMWYDSWDEVKVGTRAYGDREGWPEMPAGEIPSFQKYLQTHTLSQIVEREIDGMQSQYKNFQNAYSRYHYPLIFAGILLFELILSRRRVFSLFRKNVWQIAFFGLFIASYFFLFSWFTPIAGRFGEHLILSLFLPFIFSVFYAAKELSKYAPELKLGTVRVSGPTQLEIISFVLVLLVLFDAFSHLPGKILGELF